MFEEPEIAARLITHLARMRYPPERLDILLLLEEDDAVTAEAIRAASLPPNMRVLTVPEGHPRTKPRALNYALPFARGEIVGIYDAEDRPDPNQIAHIVRRYDEVSRDVACLQGRLDYYNTDHNLMARLFTVEYASWFRVLLPGVQRLGPVRAARGHDTVPASRAHSKRSAAGTPITSPRMPSSACGWRARATGRSLSTPPPTRRQQPPSDRGSGSVRAG
jgi:cellulose synthase/poly-beta-1,6-N-acetylglucosamine synthase-like glycosyltransferase